MSGPTYLTRDRYDAGNVYGVHCEDCGTVLSWTWDKREAKQVRRDHNRWHRAWDRGAL